MLLSTICFAVVVEDAGNEVANNNIDNDDDCDCDNVDDGSNATSSHISDGFTDSADDNDAGDDVLAYCNDCHTFFVCFSI